MKVSYFRDPFRIKGERQLRPQHSKIPKQKCCFACLIFVASFFIPISSTLVYDVAQFRKPRVLSPLRFLRSGPTYPWLAKMDAAIIDVLVRYRKSLSFNLQYRCYCYPKSKIFNIIEPHREKTAPMRKQRRRSASQ